MTFGEPQMKFLRDRDMLSFVDAAKKYLTEYPDRFELPRDLAYNKDGARVECTIDNLPQDAQFIDIGAQTIADYQALLASAKTIFANGPAASMSRTGSTSVHAESGAALLTATLIPSLAAVTPYPAQPSLLI